jgi:polysaccharide pyruvyl transferase WcaK-like protein
MSKINILHLASHTGNIGDNASHIGLKKILSKTLKKKYNITQLEIRKSYNIYSGNDKLVYDEKFAKKVNRYDLLIIGGGNYLDYSITGSCTGTTLNIKPEILKKIKVPIMIVSMGCYPPRDIPKGNIEKFKNFLNSVIDSEKITLALRNDGSKEFIKRHVGSRFNNKIPEILDNGFFYENNLCNYNLIKKKYIVMNTSNDKFKMKNNEIIRNIDLNLYNENYLKIINYVLSNSNYDIVFVPHLYTNISAINRIINKIDDYNMRTRISIAPYLHGYEGTDKLFSIYKKSELALCIRLHSNICSLAMNKLNIGLASLDRLIYMYEKLDLKDRYVKVDNEFSEEVIKKMGKYLDDKEKILENTKYIINQKKRETLDTYKKMLCQLNFEIID